MLSPVLLKKCLDEPELSDMLVRLVVLALHTRSETTPFRFKEFGGNPLTVRERRLDIGKRKRFEDSFRMFADRCAEYGLISSPKDLVTENCLNDVCDLNILVSQ